ncbi:MAG: hypothetical protein AAF721_33350, partial [Myxococcota bacterium]
MKTEHRRDRGALVALIACAVACSAGDGANGFGSAASIGGSNAGTADGTAGADWVGTIDDGVSATGIGTFGGQTGSPDESSGDGPTNPNEVCNGLDDDNNGMVDDGLGNMNCGVGLCENTVPACTNGVPGVCTPLAVSDE